MTKAKHKTQPQWATVAKTETVDRDTGMPIAAAPNPPVEAAPERRITRETRKPFGSKEQKMAREPIEGFHIHWFNDIPGRIDRAKESGYEHVLDKSNRPERLVVGKSEEGSPIYAYLMKIPQQWYEDDMAAQQADVDRIDDQIRRGVLSKGKDDNRYVPESLGIKISRSR